MKHPNLRAAITRFLSRERSKHVVAYLENPGFLEHLEANWTGPELVVAIVEGEQDVRGSLAKRKDAFAYAGTEDVFGRDTWLVLDAGPEGARFEPLETS